MRKTIQRLKNERGLTLVELLAVIVILAIIAVIAFVFIGGVIENSKKDAHIANAQQIISAAKLSEATGEDLSGDGVSVEDLQKSDHLDQVLDPWDKKTYTEETLKNTKVKKVEDGGYQITGFVPNTSTNCKELTDVKETELATEGRELCDED